MGGDKKNSGNKPNLVKAVQSVWNFITEQIDDDDDIDSESIFADNSEMGDFFRNKGISSGLGEYEYENTPDMDEIRTLLKNKMTTVR